MNSFLFWLIPILLFSILAVGMVIFLKRKMRDTDKPSPKLKKKSLVFSTEEPGIFINWAAPILEIFEDRRTRAQRRKARRERAGGRRDEDK